MALKRTGKTRTRGGEKQHLYAARFYVNGKDTRRHIWATSKAEAERMVDTIKGQIGNLTWAEGLRLWLEAHTATERHEKALQSAVDRIGPGSKIEATSLQRFASFLSDAAKTHGGGAAAHHRTDLLALSRWCRRNGYIDAIPFEHVPTVQYKKQERAAIPLEHLPRYFEIMTPAVRPILLFVAFTGARSGAACRLQHADISSGQVITHEKGGVTQVYEYDEVLQAIVRMAGTTSGHVFLTARGTPWNADKLCKRWRALWSKHLDGELPYRRIHELRHTFGTLAAELGFSSRLIQAAMGHRSEVSARSYTHLTAAAGQQVRDKTSILFLSHLEHLFGQNPPKPTRADQTPPQAPITCPHCGKSFDTNEKGANP